MAATEARCRLELGRQRMATQFAMSNFYRTSLKVEH